jgi:hypothetical protein
MRTFWQDLRYGARMLMNRPGFTLIPVSPDFFRTMEIPLRAGRVFSDRDMRETTQVAVVNEYFARATKVDPMAALKCD